jgi:hypothetical protein
MLTHSTALQKLWTLHSQFNFAVKTLDLSRLLSLTGLNCCKIARFSLLFTHCNDFERLSRLTVHIAVLLQFNISHLFVHSQCSFAKKFGYSTLHSQLTSIAEILEHFTKQFCSKLLDISHFVDLLSSLALEFLEDFTNLDIYTCAHPSTILQHFHLQHNIL